MTAVLPTASSSCWIEINIWLINYYVDTVVFLKKKIKKEKLAFSRLLRRYHVYIWKRVAISVSQPVSGIAPVSGWTEGRKTRVNQLRCTINTFVPGRNTDSSRCNSNPVHLPCTQHTHSSTATTSINLWLRMCELTIKVANSAGCILIGMWQMHVSQCRRLR